MRRTASGNDENYIDAMPSKARSNGSRPTTRVTGSLNLFCKQGFQVPNDHGGHIGQRHSM